MKWDEYLVSFHYLQYLFPNLEFKDQELTLQCFQICVKFKRPVDDGFLSDSSCLYNHCQNGHMFQVILHYWAFT